MRDREHGAARRRPAGADDDDEAAARAVRRCGAAPKMVAVFALVLFSLPVNETGSRFRSAGMSPAGGQGSAGAGNGLFESESLAAYLKALPPRRQGAAADDGLEARVPAAMRPMGGGALPEGTPHGKVTMMLDLDKTCLWGNDGNDLGLSLQWMEKPPELVRELYSLLVHPALRPAYEAYKERGEVEVVIYTRRPQLLQYRSCVTGKELPLRYEADWHYGGQMHIPSSMREAKSVQERYSGPSLDEDEEHDVLKGLERLLAARDAVSQALGLSSPPPVVVTASQKDVELTARQLGLDASTAVLYDDNDDLKWNPRVVHVEPFVELPRAQREKLLSFLDENMPVEELDEDLLEYLEGANPAEEALRMCPFSGRMAWWIPKRKVSLMPKWRILDAPPGCSPHELAARKQRLELNTTLKLRLSASCSILPLEHLGSKDGGLSPVTEPSSPPAVDLKHKAGAMRRACTNLEFVCANIQSVEAQRLSFLQACAAQQGAAGASNVNTLRKVTWPTACDVPLALD